MARRLGSGLTFVTLAGLAACSAYAPSNGEGPSAQTASAVSATNSDASTALLRVYLPSKSDSAPAVATNHQVFILDCPSPTGLTDLISGAGLNPLVLGITPVSQLDDLVRDGHMPLPPDGFVQESDLGHLRCNAGALGASVIAIDYGPGDRRYFADLKETDADGKSILRNIGCGELLHAMGLDPIEATVLPKAFVEAHFRLDDAYDVNCAAGQKPSDYLPRLDVPPGTSLVQGVKRNDPMAAITFIPKNIPTGVTPVLKIDPSDDCHFFSLSGMTVNGVVPSAFAASTCTGHFYAEVGTFTTASVAVTINMGPPTLTCAANLGDCNSNIADGCETHLDTSVTNCGACGNVCNPGANATASCVSSVCKSTCNDGYADRNNNAADGCETPLVIQALNGFIDSYALRADGQVYSWGYDVPDDGGTVNRVPHAISFGGPVIKIASGTDHACGILANGSAKCWGANDYGQLGNGSTDAGYYPSPVLGIGTSLNPVVGMGGGAYHSCAIVKDTSPTGFDGSPAGALFCFGRNQSGQLGDGSTVDRIQPGAITLGNVTEMAGGNSHTCARTGDGKLYCWGYNHYGQLGDGTTTDRKTPTAVNFGGRKVKGIAAGDWHSCALLDDNTVWCWGQNDIGQLGDGTKIQRNAPVAVSSLGATIKSIDAGGSVSCAVTLSGGARCWGHNYAGALGGGGTDISGPSGSSVPVAVVGLGSSGVKSITTGGVHTCVVQNDGTEWCWGDNMWGQLGDGSTVSSVSPVRTQLVPSPTSTLHVIGGPRFHPPISVIGLTNP